ncbi:MAG: anti-sigma factor family protein [Candidatus Zixiibacteriota bacterium]
MNCRKVRRYLFSYFKNELPEAEKTEIELHLKGCPDCAKEALEIRRITSLVKDSLETLTPSPDFNQKLLSEVQKLSSAERVEEVGRPSFFPARILGLETKFRWALAGSLVAIMIVSILWFTHKWAPSGSEPITEESKRAESIQLVTQEERADSVPRRVIKRLMGESEFRGKTYVLDSFRWVGSRGIDGMERLEDLHKRFIIETARYGADRRKRGSHFVLPAVSTQQASEKMNY